MTKIIQRRQVKPQKRPKTKEGRATLRQKLPLFLLTCVFYLASLVFCALLLLKSERAPQTDLYFVLGFLAPAAFFSSYFAARKEKKHGLLTGFLWTLPLHVLLLGLSLLFGSGKADLTLGLSFTVLSLLSMLGGVAGVNHRETVHHRKSGPAI